MTPSAYFKKYRDACAEAARFCYTFPTMRAAWLSDKVDVSHMCWALGRHRASIPGLRTFATWCVTQACAQRKHETKKYARLVGIMGRPHECYREAATCACYAADDNDDGSYSETKRAAQREKLRELFPRMFLPKKKPKAKGAT